METDLGDLEESKENVLPLRRGRKIATLQAALDESAKDRLAQTKQQFETDLRLYTGDDELEIWYPYILWVEQNFPKGGQDGNLSVLLRQCLNHFLSKPQYKDDERYIECWLKFVRYSPSTMEVFLVMDAHEIGHKSAAFYEAWSWHLEQLGNFRKANIVLQEGIDNNAQPLKILYDAQKQLSRKFVQHFSSAEHKEEVIDSRAALGGLKPIGKKGLAPITRVGNARLEGPISHPLNFNQVQPSSQNARFHVLQDAENIPSVKSKTHLLSVPSDTWVSENQVQRKPWNNVKLRSTSSKLSTVQQKPEFTVHEDNGQNLGLGRKIDSGFSTVLRCSRVGTKIGFIEPDDPQKLYVCDIQKLYGGAVEFQPEEIAAARWHQNEKKKQEEDQVNKLKEELQKLKTMAATMNQAIPRSDENLKKQNSMSCQHLTQEPLGVETRRLDTGSFGNSGKSSPRSECSSPTRDVMALWSTALRIPAKDEVSNSDTEKAAFQVYKDDQRITAPKKTTFQIYTDDQEKAAPKKPFQVYTDDGEPKKQAFEKDHQRCTATKKPTFQIYADEQNNAASKKPAFQVYTDDEENVEPKKQTFQVYSDENEKTSLKKSDLKQPAFHIYTDNQEKNLHENLPSSANPPTMDAYEKDDYKENMAPSGFVQNVKERASPHNILQVTDRPFEFGYNEDDDQDDDLGVHPLPDSECHTIAPLTTELHFFQNLKVSSTPCAFNQMSTKSDHFVQPAQVSTQSTVEFKTPCNAGKLGLSPITEASREISKSSSAYTTSSSSSASSLAQSTRRITPSAKSLLCPSTSVISPLDPFDPELISTFLSSVNLVSRAGYLRIEGDISRMQKQKCFAFGHHKFRISTQIAEGGEGVIYKAENEDDMEWPRELIVKIYKPTNLWEFYICSELRSRIGKVPGIADVRESLPSILLSPVYNSCNLLVTEYCPFGTLVDLVNSYWNMKEVIPEGLTLYLTWEILQIVRQLHASQFVHCDIKPDNFMVLTLPTDIKMLDFSKTQCVRLIDFGQSIDLSMFPKGTTFNGSIKTPNFICPEMQENKPWIFQTDYFGILGTIHSMLFCGYMEVIKVNEKWEIKNRFKRYWQIQFWNRLFDTLLNVPDCEHFPDLSAFADELELMIAKTMKESLVSAGTKHLTILKSGRNLKK